MKSRRGHRTVFAFVLAATVLLAGAVFSPAARGQAAPPGEEPKLPPLDAATRHAVIDSVTATLKAGYIFADVAAKMEELVRGNLTGGKYDAITAGPVFADKLTEDLQSISHDKHLRVRYLPPEAPDNQPGVTDQDREKRMLAEAAARNYGFQKVERLAGNVGYVDFRNFFEAQYGGETAIAAMNFLAHSDALIFDLRQNGGGSPSMIQLISSYLFEEPVHLNDFYIRREDSTQQFWTQASVRGPRLTDVPVYVLTSGFTFSGAEEFTYNLKNLKRATIVGETTGGGAHPVDMVMFPNLHFGMSLPFGRAINPITKTNWEGTGVEPDIKVPADQALAVAHLEALKALREKADDPEKKQGYDWTITGLELQGKPVTLPAKQLRGYTGSFGPRKIWEEKGNLYYQRAPQPRRRLIPAGNDLFLVENLDYFRVKFARDGSGKVVKIVGLYDNGQEEESPKSGS